MWSSKAHNNNNNHLVSKLQSKNFFVDACIFSTAFWIEHRQKKT